MKLISRLIFTRQLRSMALWLTAFIATAYIINISAVQFFGAYGGFTFNNQFFNVSVSYVSDFPSPGTHLDIANIIGTTTLGLAGLLPFVAIGVTLPVFAESIRAWLGAGVNRQTIFTTCQAFIGLITLSMTGITTALIGGLSVIYPAMYTGFSSMTVLDTFLLYLGLLELFLLGTAIFLRLALWLALTISFGVPILCGFLIGNFFSALPRFFAELVSGSTLLQTALVLGISIIMALLSWAFLARHLCLLTTYHGCFWASTFC